MNMNRIRFSCSEIKRGHERPHVFPVSRQVAKHPAIPVITLKVLFLYHPLDGLLDLGWLGKEAVRELANDLVDQVDVPEYLAILHYSDDTGLRKDVRGQRVDHETDGGAKLTSH